MRRVMRLLKVPADRLLEPELADVLDDDELLEALAGYIAEEHSFAPPADIVRAWGCLVVVTTHCGEPRTDVAMPMQPRLNGARPRMLQLRPVGRLVPVGSGDLESDVTTATPGNSRGEQGTASTIQVLQPVRSGRVHSITSSPAQGLVRPELAEALETVFERFARAPGFTPDTPLEIRLSRGFKARSHGHGEGRAADIAAVGGESLLEWKRQWDRALAAAEKLPDPQQRAEAMAAEQQRNLGYGLYKAMQAHGGWRVNQGGWRLYRDVEQLFGPWTATEGPWKAMQIKNPNPHQQQRLADQRWVFQAHQDHIHVAR